MNPSKRTTEQDEMTTFTNEQAQAQATAGMKAIAEFKTCKRNAKTGKVNGNSRNAVVYRYREAMMAAGMDSSTAWSMAHELSDVYAK